MGCQIEDHFGSHRETKHMMIGNLRSIFTALRTGHFYLLPKILIPFLMLC